MSKPHPQIQAAVLAAQSLTPVMRPQVEPLAPGMVVASKRHNDYDAADVQDGPEREPVVVVQIPDGNFVLNAQTGTYGITGIPIAMQAGAGEAAPK